MFDLDQYNPDVLSCLANLSSDEVFTPPAVANQVLDILPPEIWHDQNATFLDPGCKSGVFLREIAKRLDQGLETQTPNRQKRMNHIFKNQLFALANTELTALLSRRSVYCSKTANGRYSVCDGFNDADGNIRFQRIEHTWKSGCCVFCGASKSTYGRGSEMETHAYEFIHAESPEEMLNMKFDVIVSNPPYQLSDGGGIGTSAKPIYHLFVQRAQKLNPRYLTMVIPSRWFAGGKGLDNFRVEMLNDDRIRKIVDYENAREIFPGVDIAGGVCYFLWSRDDHGLCEVTNGQGDKITSSVRALNEFSTFVRQSQSVAIIRKVLLYGENNNKRLSEAVSPRNPFALPSTCKPKKSGIPCWFIQRTGRHYINPDEVSDANGLLDKWKLLIPKAPIAGQTDFTKPIAFYYDANTRIAKPGECCTESWLVAGAFDTEPEIFSFRSYLLTKIVRFLLLQTVVSQNTSRKNFVFVPYLGEYKGEYTDDALRKRWSISQEEWDFIDSRIK